MSPVEPDPDARFRAVYASTYADVLRFAQRRVHPSHAEDVVAATSADVVEAGSTNSAPASLRVAPRAFTQGGVTGSVAGQDGERSAGFSATDGLVGDDVVAVTLHAGGTTAQATVDDGWYGAWWPGPAFAGGSDQTDGEGDLEPQITYDLTLTDGTVIRDAQPAQPF